MPLHLARVGSPRSLGNSAWIAVLALTISCLHYGIAGDIGINLWDEGYLWNNVQRTFQGDVPIRDFRSYDPGRYYWGALFFHLFGADFWSLRLAESVALGLGLWMGLAALSRAVPGRLALAGLGVLIAFAAFPMHKSFEIALIMLALLTMVRLLESPSWSRHLQAGIVIGLTAFFARNLAVYFLCGFLALSLTALARESLSRWHRFQALAFGIAIGYSPMLPLLISHPGSMEALADSVLRLTGPHAPVVSIPAPWPWIFDTAQLRTSAGRLNFALGITQCGLILGYAAGLGMALRWPRTRTPLILASLAVGIPCMHHVLVRANYSHLAQVAFPALAGLFGGAHFLHSSRRVPASHLLGGVGLLFLAFLIFRNDSVGAIYRRAVGVRKGSNAPTPYMVDHRALWVPAGQANQMRKVGALIEGMVRPGEPFFIAPFQPGYYLLHGRTAPTWDAFPIHLATAEEQQAMIRALEVQKIRIALVDNRRLDGISGREFSATHSLVWEHLAKRFQRTEASPASAGLTLFRREH